MFKNRKNLVSISLLEKIQKHSSKGVRKKFAEYAGKTIELESFFKLVNWKKIQKQSSKTVLKIFAEFSGKHLSWSLF